MPVLRLVHAAQPNIAHCVINNGYSIRKGGVGTVNIMVTLHPMLRNQARISSTHLTGLDFQSSRTQLATPVRKLFIDHLTVQLLTSKILAFGFALNVKLGGKSQDPVITGSVPHHVTVSP